VATCCRAARPRTPAEVLNTISGLLTFLHVLPMAVSIVAGLIDLIRRHPVTGGDIFDLQIVATMRANSVNRIYTFNGQDFEVFPELAIITP
jgi:predicted nucleic acid-binding protein